MSLTPFRDNLPVKAKARPSASSSRLTLSQALTITAGMAGLVGLLSGGIIRFSLANSSNARFLSPLQTFPAVSDWSSQPDSETAEASPLTRPSSGSVRSDTPSSEGWQEPTDLDWSSDANDFDAFRTDSFTDNQSTTELQLEPLERWNRTIEINESLEAFSAPGDFDAFANRGAGRRPVAADPLKSLSEGPLLRRPLPEDAAESFESRYEKSLDDDVPYDSTTELTLPSVEDTFPDAAEYDRYADDEDESL